MSQVHENKKKVKTAYQQLSGILNALKSNELSVNEAMSQIQLKEGGKKYIERPYCKVVNGVLQLNGVTEEPISMNFQQWTTFLNLVKSNYIDNYIKYNGSRITDSGIVSNQSDNEKQNAPPKSKKNIIPPGPKVPYVKKQPKEKKNKNIVVSDLTSDFVEVEANNV